VLRDYLLPATRATRAGQVEAATADVQYRNWIAAADRPVPLRAAPNGTAFLRGYKDWKVVSSTDRMDTGTLRIILGNDVAIKAIAESDINPWPDGTTFAKVA
jgi:hypothetical protein